MKAMIKTLAVAGLAALANAALALPTVTIDSVTQRWPWNNKADITYTVSDGQDLANSVFYRLKFKTTIGGTEYTIDGTTDVGASMNTGTHTVTWTLPAGVQASDCTIYAEVYEATAPSGDDYMIVDLTDGSITYEGLLATQDDSNGRYTNNVAYKTTKLVLRKIPKGGTYPVGRNNASSNSSDTYDPRNTPKNWTTDRDYYIGIFEFTLGQQYAVAQTGTSGSTVPIYQMTWVQARGDVSPTNAPAAGSLLYKLNALTSTGAGVSGFDLPTEIMYEIADRAGNTGKFWWATTAWTPSASDAAPYGRVGNIGSRASVGSYTANPFGLYDTLGNVCEWCLDDTSLTGDLATAPDPWTPACADGNTERRYRSCGHKSNLTDKNVRTSSRSKNEMASKINTGMDTSGFRVAYIVK